MKQSFKFLQKNYGWIVALLTGLGIIGTFVLRFIKYIHSVVYFEYYGISYGLFDNTELNYLYDFVLSILMIACFYSMIYCYKQIYDIIVDKKRKFQILINLSLILISNLVFLYLLEFDYHIGKMILYAFILVISEIIMAVIFTAMLKKNVENNGSYEKKDMLTNYLKLLPFYLFAFIAVLGILYRNDISRKKTYHVVAENKVIVYTNNSYYILLDCEIDGENLIIHRGRQKLVDNIDIESTLKKFEKVVVK